MTMHSSGPFALRFHGVGVECNGRILEPPARQEEAIMPLEDVRNQFSNLKHARRFDESHAFYDPNLFVGQQLHADGESLLVVALCDFATHEPEKLPQILPFLLGPW
jgi:hypothetical protein